MNFLVIDDVHKRTHCQFTAHTFPKPTRKHINKANFMQTFILSVQKFHFSLQFHQISPFSQTTPRTKQSRFVAAKTTQKLRLHRRPLSHKSSHPNRSGNFSLGQCHCTSPDLLNSCKFDAKDSIFPLSHQKAINSALLLYLNHPTTKNGNKIVEKNQKVLCKGEKVL